MKKESVFAKEFSTYENIMAGEALSMGERLLDEALEMTFKDLSDEVLINFVRSALESIDERGLVNLLPNAEGGMDGDCRVCLMYHPGYATVAVAIYLKNRLGMEATEWMDSALKPLMEKLFSHGIVGHGYDAGDMMRRTMIILGKAGAREFVEKHPDYSKDLTDCTDCLITFVSLALEDDNLEYARGEFSDTPILAQVLACWYGNEHPVFVYGTLKRGGRASELMSSATYGGQAILPDYDMYNLGSYPGIVENKGGKVPGEIFYVNQETLERLDEYEGEGYFYRRVLKPVIIEEKTVSCYVYEYARPIIDGEKITMWNPDNEKYIWYACYGSNLSAARFRCYIEGGTLPQNGRTYKGCSDKTLWTESIIKRFDGRMYFGNRSSSWGGKGVAFYNPDEEGSTVMRLYRIKWSQLLDVQEQEGNYDNWYGNLLLLGSDYDGTPIFTLTSKSPREHNAPSEEYLELIRTALRKECKQSKAAVEKYLKECL